MAFLFRRLGTTVFHVTHDPSEAFAMADRIVIMNKGNIDQIDTPQNCYRNPKTESVAALLGAGNAVHGTASARTGRKRSALGGVSCMAAGREGICREDPVSIRFRAENAVWRGDQNEGNGFPVTVEYSSFEGDFYRVMAKTAEGEPLCFLSREFLKKGVPGLCGGGKKPSLCVRKGMRLKEAPIGNAPKRRSSVYKIPPCGYNEGIGGRSRLFPASSSPWKGVSEWIKAR